MQIRTRNYESKEKIILIISIADIANISYEKNFINSSSYFISRVKNAQLRERFFDLQILRHTKTVSNSTSFTTIYQNSRE